MNQRILLLLDILKEASLRENHAVVDEALIARPHIDNATIRDMCQKTDLRWAVHLGFQLGFSFARWHIEQWAKGTSGCKHDVVVTGPCDASCAKGEPINECVEQR